MILDIENRDMNSLQSPKSDSSHMNGGCSALCLCRPRKTNVSINEWFTISRPGCSMIVYGMYNHFICPNLSKPAESQSSTLAVRKRPCQSDIELTVQENHCSKERALQRLLRLLRHWVNCSWKNRHHTIRLPHWSHVFWRPYWETYFKP